MNMKTVWLMWMDFMNRYDSSESISESYEEDELDEDGLDEQEKPLYVNKKEIEKT